MSSNKIVRPWKWILYNISRDENSCTKKFGQQIKYLIKGTIIEKLCRKYVMDPSSRSLFVNDNPGITAVSQN